MSTQSSPKYRPSSPSTAWIQIGLIAALLLGLLAFVSTYLKGIDYLPLIWSARLELAGKSSYGPEMQALFQQYYDNPDLVRGGFAYPLPAFWLGIPFAFLPDAIAKAIWCAVSLISVGLGLYLLKMPKAFFLFVPVLWGMSELQNSVILIGLSMIAIWAARQERWWLLAWLVVLVGGSKPQATLLCSGFLVFTLLQARQWKPLMVASLVLVGIPFLFEPNWPFAWLEAARRYNASIPYMWLFPWIPLGALLLWKRRFWPGLALIQAGLFPVILHHYALIPLILGYIDQQSSKRAWIAVVSSWVAIYLQTFLPAWLTLLLCYALPMFLLNWPWDTISRRKPSS
jgi:hypothetical protein